MIELNEKTQQDFLNRKWVQKLLDAGVNMSDAKYYLCSLRLGKLEGGENIQVSLESKLPYVRDKEGNVLKDAKGKPYFRALEVNWCVPTYTVSELLYKLHEYGYTTIELGKYILVPIIEYLASLLIQCYKKGIGDTGNISDK